VAGNNLAWLLVQEKVNPAAALEMIEEVRRGRYSRKPIGGERLPLAILDTLGVVYRAAGRNQEALELFKEAEKRYSLEPRIQYHLGCSLAALGKNKEANLRFKDAVAKATVLLKTTIDPQRKAKLTVLIQETRAELDRPQRKPI
jgi:tetratricopeptide (TPR) repeat protein